MLRKRLISAALFITPIGVLGWLDVNRNFGFPGFWILPTALMLSLLIVGELTAMLRERTVGAIGWVVYFGTVLCHIAIVVPDMFDLPTDCPVNRWGWSGIALFTTLSAAFLHELCVYQENRQSTTRIALTVFVVLYSGWLMTFLSATRLILPNDRGAMAIFSVLFVIKLSDTGAYFVGKIFGRHKLAPLLSPGKTVEGLVGGIAAAMVAAFIVFWVFTPVLLGTPKAEWWVVFAYAVSLMTAGVVGDLCESLIKRDMCCKNSSGWLSGLGGVMDTADSVVIAAPIAFLWWTTDLL